MFEVILVRIFQYSDQNNSEYGHFLRNDTLYQQQYRYILSAVIFKAIKFNFIENETPTMTSS